MRQVKHQNKLNIKISLGLDIYYIGYVNKKAEWYVNSVNPSHLMINKCYGTISEKIGNKYLTINDMSNNSDVLEKYDHVFAGIKYHIKNIREKDGEYQTDSTKIKFNTDDDIPLKKKMYFPIVTMIIRCVLRKIDCIIHKFI